MAYRKRYSRPRRKMLRRRAPRKNKSYNKAPRVQTFTEVLQAGDIPIGAGGVFKTKMDDIPQWQSYSDLYKQFCIKKLQVTIIPRLDNFPLDINASIPSVGSSFWAPRLAYSIDDTPNVQIPATELDVLTDNGVKVLSMNKPIKLTCYPKPDVGMYDLVNLQTVAVRTKKQMWLNFKNTEVGNPGVSVPHGGIRFYISGNPLFNGQYMHNVYYKVTFSVRDPA